MKTNYYAYLNLKYDKDHKKFNITILKVDQKYEKIWKNVFNLENINLIIAEDQINEAFEIKETIKLSVEPLFDGKNFLAKTENDMKIFNSKQGHYLTLSIDARSYENFLLEIYLTIFIFKGNKKKIIFQAKYYQTNLLSTVQSTIDASIAQTGTNHKITTIDKKVDNFLENDKFLYSDINTINIPYIVEKISSKVFGLTNLGNTCFLNSILQILVHSPIFIINFLNDMNKFKPNQNTLAYSLFNFLMNIYSKEKEIFSPSDFVEIFLKKCHLFRLGEQSDSERFFRNLASILETEIGPLNTCIKNAFEVVLRSRNQFYCDNIYCGKTNYQNENQQKMFVIFVSVSDESKETSINELLWNTYKEKIKQSNKLCSKCGKNLILKRGSFFNFNEYLCINIQKVDIETRMLNQTKIKINDICFDQKNNIYYTPYAINLHNGGMDYGHYYNYVKINSNKNKSLDGEWYCLNDETFLKTKFLDSSDKILNVFYKIKK